MWYLLPGWHGSYEKAEAFANAAVEITREQGKTGLDAWVYWEASETLNRHRLIPDSGVDWVKNAEGYF